MKGKSEIRSHRKTAGATEIMIPRLSLNAEEKRSQSLEKTTLQGFEGHLQNAGCLIVDEVFSMPRVYRWQKALLQRYGRYFDPEIDDHPKALRVGDKRWMVTLQIRGEFATPELYAPPLFFPWIKQTLGPECTLSSLGFVISLPGAKAQHPHRDLPLLFGDHPLDLQLPPYAITVLIPLLECNEFHGTTRVCVGSHRVSDAGISSLPEDDPLVPLGSCLFMDYRLHHYGTPNLSTKPRPLLFLVYSRPWFRDHRNFKKQPPLCITRYAFHAVPEEYKPLFAFAKKTWW